MDISPTFKGYIEDESDVLLILQATLDGKLQQIPRRPYEIERPYLIVSGNIFVFVEEISGIKRWTDGISWSPSRITGKFLVYRELDKSGAQHHTQDFDINSPASMKYTGLIKKTISVKLRRAPFHLLENFHIVSYYTLSDVQEKKILSPKHIPIFNEVTPSGELIKAMENTTLGNVKTSSSGGHSSHKHSPLDSHEKQTSIAYGNYNAPVSTNSLSMGNPVPNNSSHYFYSANGLQAYGSNGTAYQGQPYMHLSNNNSTNCNNSNEMHSSLNSHNSAGVTNSGLSSGQKIPGFPGGGSYYYTYSSSSGKPQDMSSSTSPRPLLVKGSTSMSNNNTGYVDHIQQSGGPASLNANTSLGNATPSSGSVAASIPPLNTPYYYSSTATPNNMSNPHFSVVQQGTPYHAIEGNTSMSSFQGQKTTNSTVPYLSSANGNPIYQQVSRNYSGADTSMSPLNHTSFQGYQSQVGINSSAALMNGNLSGNHLNKQGSSVTHQNLSEQHAPQNQQLIGSFSSQGLPHSQNSYAPQYYSGLQQAYNSNLEKGISKIASTPSLPQVQQNTGSTVSNLVGNSAPTPNVLPYVSSGPTHSSSMIVPSTAATTPSTLTSVKGPSSLQVNNFSHATIDRGYQYHQGQVPNENRS
ncbi:uncharacterized protein HLK63_L06369 [Nakaseomyces glabratus]|nr:Global transcription regulator sge1 [Nakaseomyces glabratus]UCS22865.1 uncharacterized protein GW608_L06369 [Nakaseomyces glabratus]UCS28097.1 uncharacterized protein HLK63_L06369 [Nakaseomyces glabratus]UCS33326.1 uncharacterized protein HLK64_L06369 [Nakaseomyces glabratus]UCS38555.1 uncharacterized protein HLK62_L06369 [Nakaseomyces glabratus]